MDRSSAASFDESPEERDQRRRERADKARPNVSMTPGQAETLAKSAAHTKGCGIRPGGYGPEEDVNKRVARKVRRQMEQRPPSSAARSWP